MPSAAPFGVFTGGGTSTGGGNSGGPGRNVGCGTRPPGGTTAGVETAAACAATWSASFRLLARLLKVKMASKPMPTTPNFIPGDRPFGMATGDKIRWFASSSVSESMAVRGSLLPDLNMLTAWLPSICTQKARISSLARVASGHLRRVSARHRHR